MNLTEIAAALEGPDAFAFLRGLDYHIDDAYFGRKAAAILADLEARGFIIFESREALTAALAEALRAKNATDGYYETDEEAAAAIVEALP